MNNTLTPKSPTPAGPDTIAEIVDGDQHAIDGDRPLRKLFQITPAGRLVWADR
ncbi:hypothetical protein H9623_13085 [Oerskovia sp. Sa1BUA8]|uniref:Uncharacterized protein n=1 Tax=Oerskovia douganii TaxID=2762210 RepID=A0A9D5YZI2_9CELL|nr:hypothetical protein [Oerskovia douganii]MBE7701230.1 hypothetical protein [Oerskovia douganii]